MDDATRNYLEAVPKVELHVHLEGAIRPETILEIAKRNRVDLPVKTVEEARDWFVFRDFYHFNKVYNAITKCLNTSDDYELIVSDLGTELARQNVHYAEVTTSPGSHVDERAFMDYTTRVAIDARPDGVVGIGLGGYNRYGPPEEFEKWFDLGLAAGLRSVPHAGEFAGPENIWGAIHSLKAERIGHGITAEDLSRIL